MSLRVKEIYLTKEMWEELGRREPTFAADAVRCLTETLGAKTF